MTDLTGRQRATLRSMANNYETIFQIGKGGITDEIIRQIENALEARELIKLRVLDTCPYTSREAANMISEKTGAVPVSVVGSRFVLYRPSTRQDKKDKIILP